MPASDVKNGNPVRYWATPKTFTDGQDFSFQGDASGNALTSQGTLSAGEDLTNDVTKTEQRASYANITSDTLIKTGAGRFWGFIVNSHTSGTVKVWDNTSAASVVILNTITLAAGPAMWVSPVAIEFITGLFVDIGGTIDLTVLYK